MNNVAIKQDTQVMATPADLLRVAVEAGADLDKLEKLMDLQERWQAGEAKKAFSNALAKFQADMPSIQKTRNAHNSKYADIDDIAKAIRPVLTEAGLSYRFEQKQEGMLIRVSCIVTHEDGHSETTALEASADTSGGKNEIQAIASAVTYLRRYTLTGALGITTGLDDDDGGKPKVTVDELIKYMDCARDNLQTLAAMQLAFASNDYATAKEAWSELDEEEMRILWRATTKGSLFTVEDRAKMKSSEWSSA